MSPMLAYGVPLAGLIVGLVVLRGWRARSRQDAPALTVVGGIMSAVMAIGLFAVSDPRGLFEDFRDAYLGAGIAVHAAPASLAPVIEKGIDGFVNLPIVAYLFWPFASLSTTAAVLVFSVIGLLFTLGAWHALVRGMDLDRVSMMTLLFVFAASGPLVYSIKEGNISHFLLWPLVVAMLALRRGDDFRAGAVLGLIALLKLPFLLFGIYYLLRGRWRVTVGGLLVCAAASLASLAIFGWDLHVRWYEYCIEPYGRDPMPAFNVQSVQAFVLRLQLGAQGLLRWDVVPLTGWGVTLSAALVALLYAGTLLVLWCSRQRRAGQATLPSPFRSPASDAEFMLIMGLACITSPVSWSHYFCWFLLPAASFLKAAQEPGVRAPPMRWLGWCALVIGSVPVVTIGWTDPGLAELHARSLTSLLLFGGLAWMVWLGCQLRGLEASSRDVRWAGRIARSTTGRSPSSMRDPISSSSGLQS